MSWPQIKLFNFQILMFLDRNKLQDMQQFINYVDARPFKFHVMKIIPMDVTLPIMLLNICITYLIILLQLTHLY